MPTVPGFLAISKKTHILIHPLKWTIQKPLVKCLIRIQWTFLNAHFPWTFWSFGPCQLLPSIWSLSFSIDDNAGPWLLFISVITLFLSNLSPLLLSSQFTLRITIISHLRDSVQDHVCFYDNETQVITWILISISNWTCVNVFHPYTSSSNDHWSLIKFYLLGKGSQDTTNNKNYTAFMKLTAWAVGDNC